MFTDTCEPGIDTGELSSRLYDGRGVVAGIEAIIEIVVIGLVASCCCSATTTSESRRS